MIAALLAELGRLLPAGRVCRRVLLEAEDHLRSAVDAAVAKWLPVAQAEHLAKASDQLVRDAATVKFTNGDVAAAHADVLRVWHPQPDPTAPTRALDGTVCIGCVLGSAMLYPQALFDAESWIDGADGARLFGQYGLADSINLGVAAGSRTLPAPTANPQRVSDFWV
ncbi:MAG: hypothetical protein JOZ75_12200, partial [Candidatus Dormibacteraeota bacterium]|nr:hypothetical protein [Candidatus Dormibacteraeota bacterium]